MSKKDRRPKKSILLMVQEAGQSRGRFRLGKSEDRSHRLHPGSRFPSTKKHTRRNWPALQVELIKLQEWIRLQEPEGSGHF